MKNKKWEFFHLTTLLQHYYYFTTTLLQLQSKMTVFSNQYHSKQTPLCSDHSPWYCSVIGPDPNSWPTGSCCSTNSSRLSNKHRPPPPPPAALLLYTLSPGPISPPALDLIPHPWSSILDCISARGPDKLNIQNPCWFAWWFHVGEGGWGHRWSEVLTERW